MILIDMVRRLGFENGEKGLATPNGSKEIHLYESKAGVNRVSHLYPLESLSKSTYHPYSFERAEAA